MQSLMTPPCDTYHRSIANHTESFHNRVLLDGLINLENVREQTFAQMTANCINFSHENAGKREKGLPAA